MPSGADVDFLLGQHEISQPVPIADPGIEIFAAADGYVLPMLKTLTDGDPLFADGFIQKTVTSIGAHGLSPNVALVSGTNLAFVDGDSRTDPLLGGQGPDDLRGGSLIDQALETDKNDGDIRIDTVFRDNSICLTVQNLALAQTDGEPVRLRLANSDDLPFWISSLEPGLYLIDPPAGMDRLDLTVIASLAQSIEREISVSIDARTGMIVEPGATNSTLAMSFADQTERAINQSTETVETALGRL